MQQHRMETGTEAAGTSVKLRPQAWLCSQLPGQATALKQQTLSGTWCQLLGTLAEPSEPSALQSPPGVPCPAFHGRVGPGSSLSRSKAQSHHPIPPLEGARATAMAFGARGWETEAGSAHKAPPQVPDCFGNSETHTQPRSRFGVCWNGGGF